MSCARWAAAIVAAGRGQRFGRPKQLLDIAGLPMVGWSIRTFAAMPEVGAIAIATEEPWVEAMRALCARLVCAREVRVVTGGATRQHSVANVLEALPDTCDRVLVHDGARPLVRAEDVREAMNQVRPGRAALLANRIVDTVKVVEPVSHRALETLDRDLLWAAQTPQLATVADLLRAHARARADGVAATDDAALLERIGVEVVVVPASGENFKVTLPSDLARAEAVLRERSAAEVAR